MTNLHTTGLVLAFLLAGSGSGQDRKDTSRPVSPGVTIYANKAGDLRKLMQDILKAAKSGDQRAVTTYVEALVVPDSDSWFSQAFGDALRGQLATTYKNKRAHLLSQLSDTFEWVAREKLTDIGVRRYDDACNPTANEFQYPVLAARQKQEPLYEVQLMRAGYGKVLWFFAYIDGGFRYLGEPLLTTDSLAMSAVRGDARNDIGGSPEAPRAIVGGIPQQAKLIH